MGGGILAGTPLAGLATWQLLAAYNGVVLVIYAWDKLCARLGWWRVREAHLLLLAACFGGAGALAGIYGLRHKTRKAPFAIGVPVLLLMQGALAVFGHLRGWWP